MTPPLGIVEGYYGRPWSDTQRLATIEFLAPFGYAFFVYAPKAERSLRDAWRDPMAPEATARLYELATACDRIGVRLTVGLGPAGAEARFDAAARRALGSRLALFRECGIRGIAILFDDRRGTGANLADRQADVVQWVAEQATLDYVAMCPTYYSHDRALDRLHGPRPDGYLARLGMRLDASIGVYWTGEEICAHEHTVASFADVAEQLRRAPILWDNYPVNDGVRMSQHLHLRAFTGRPAALAGVIAAHAINPALQPVLTRIPALTLADSYALGERYSYGAAFERAAQRVAGAPLAACLREDLALLQDVGLDRLGTRAVLLRERYGAFDQPAAAEILAWLEGAYRGADELG
jgi:hyaluronoglucosaminidase